jgi:Transposase DDE domain
MDKHSVPGLSVRYAKLHQMQDLLVRLNPTNASVWDGQVSGQVLDEDNREKSRIRARVEHVFGSWIMGMGGKFLRTIGLANAKVQLGLKNLTYNLIRFTWLETRAVKPAIAG